MSENYKRDGKVEIGGTVGSGGGDTVIGSELRSTEGDGGCGGGSGTKGKGRYKPNGRGQGWAKKKLKHGQVKWLKEHYADTKNEELCRHLGVSHGTLHRFARQYRLKKSAEFMEMCTHLGWKAAKAKGEATDWAANRAGARRYYAYCRANGIPHSGFKKGHNGKSRFSAEQWAEIMAKAKATRNETIARDKRRVRLGLEPLTKLVHATRMTPKEVRIRSYMKTHYGYIVRKGDAVIRYDDTTRRCASTEERARAMGMAVIHVRARIVDEALR